MAAVVSNKNANKKKSVSFSNSIIPPPAVPHINHFTNIHNFTRFEHKTPLQSQSYPKTGTKVRQPIPTTHKTNDNGSYGNVNNTGGRRRTRRKRRTHRK